MQKLKKKIDNVHNLNNLKTNLHGKSANDFKNNEKVVGIKIDTNSKEYVDKVYYYKTTKNLKVGDKINPIMPTKGTPDCVVVSVGKKGYRSLKELELG